MRAYFDIPLIYTTLWVLHGLIYMHVHVAFSNAVNKIRTSVAGAYIHISHQSILSTNVAMCMSFQLFCGIRSFKC